MLLIIIELLIFLFDPLQATALLGKGRLLPGFPVNCSFHLRLAGLQCSGIGQQSRHINSAKLGEQITQHFFYSDP